jgi:hypothetical protein
MLRKRVTYANVVATLALFIVLGGGAYAASKLPKNSVGSRQIKKNSITSAKVKNHSLLAVDFKSGQLPAGRQGPQGPKGDTGLPGTLPDTLPSGKTLYGTYSVLGHATGSTNDRSSSAISFPFPLAAAPSRSVLVPSGGPNPDSTNCPGSATAPAATAGTLCVYEGDQGNTTGSKICRVSATALCGSGANGAADRFGATVNVFAAADGVYISTGTWAVTAP